MKILLHPQVFPHTSPTEGTISSVLKDHGFLPPRTTLSPSLPSVSEIGKNQNRAYDPNPRGRTGLGDPPTVSSRGDVGRGDVSCTCVFIVTRRTCPRNSTAHP